MQVQSEIGSLDSDSLSIRKGRIWDWLGEDKKQILLTISSCSNRDDK